DRHFVRSRLQRNRRELKTTAAERVALDQVAVRIAKRHDRFRPVPAWWPAGPSLHLELGCRPQSILDNKRLTDLDERKTIVNLLRFITLHSCEATFVVADLRTLGVSVLRLAQRDDFDLQIGTRRVRQTSSGVVAGAVRSFVARR